jgi:hypothetical protein
MIRIVALIAFGLLVSAAVIAQDDKKFSLRACDAAVGKENLIGERLRFVIPEKAIVKRRHDSDYNDYWIAFGNKKNRSWLHGGFGPQWSGGRPTKMFTESTRFEETRTWDFGLTGHNGLDIKGRTAEGKFSRFFGGIGDTLVYEGVPKEAAEYFDSIINSVCYQPWQRKESNE